MSETQTANTDEGVDNGDSREVDEEAQEHLESLSERYKMFITNKMNTPHVAYELDFVDEDGRDTPVIFNTGGTDMMHSRSADVGGDDALELDERFFNSIAYAHHQVMCFMTQMHPHRQKQKIDETIAIFYENDAGVNQVPDQERWAIHMIVNHIVYSSEEDPVLYEFGPIVEYADMVTEWGTPPVRDL